MKKCIVIPTYWGPMDGTEEIVFDHPTPLNSDGTLWRLLENLSNFKEVRSGDVKVCVVGVANRNDLREKVEKKLEECVGRFKRFMDVKLYSYSWIRNIKSFLADKGLNNFDLFEPRSYPQVRNLCLLAALEMGVNIAIFLDDDELITTTDFFERAEFGMFEKGPDEGIVHGKAGYYVQDRPSYRRFWELKWWPKDLSFNRAFERLRNSTTRLTSTLIGLGGLMIIGRELMRNVCFDKNITRGEDMDYIFNARLFGYRFYFDKELCIEHVPPESKTPEWRKARQDILRFLYIRSKYRSHLRCDKVQKIAFEELLPYPGIFMQEDLEDRILEYCKMMAMKYLIDGNVEGFDGCMENAKIPFTRVNDLDVLEEYLHQVATWRKATAALLEG